MKNSKDYEFNTKKEKERQQTLIALIKQEIVKYDNRKKTLSRYNRPAYIVAAAIVHVGMGQARERLKKRGADGWICGTYTNRVVETHERKISRLFPEESLKGLINYCHNDEFGQSQADKEFENMLSILGENVPDIMIHQFHSLEYFED